MYRYSLSASIILLFAATALTAGMAPFEILDRYTGRWEGAVRIYTGENELMEEWKISQHYWWDGDIQRALAVFDRRGHLHYAESRIAIREGRPVSRTYYGDQHVRDTVGRILSSGSIAWIPADPDLAAQQQLIETIVESDGGSTLRLEGHENAEIGAHVMTVRLAGELKRLPDRDPSHRP